MNTTLIHQKIDSLPDGLKTEISDYLDFLIEKRMKPVMKQPKFGSGKGFFTVKDDFDAPLEDFKEYIS